MVHQKTTPGSHACYFAEPITNKKAQIVPDRLPITDVVEEPIANQVFVGCPWKTVRRKYEKAIDYLRKQFPLSFVIVGRDDSQDAEDLLSRIKQRLTSSSYAIFDATGGNANVSLEFGFAEARGIDRALYLCTHRASSSPKARESPIIADLAGKTRTHYTVQDSLHKRLSEFCKKHPYTVRFERFFRDRFRSKSKGEKKRLRAACLKVIHSLDGLSQRRRADVVSALQADPVGYKEAEISQLILELHRGELILSIQGPHSTISIR